MPNMDGLLQAILEEPDSDDLRLIYADWLDEQGQEERAEFIRVQIELASSHCQAAGTLDGPYDVYCDNSLCRHCELDRRATELLGRVRAHLSGHAIAEEEWQWLPVALQEIWLQVSHCWDSEQPNWLWRRGFIEVVDFYCQDWLAHGPELVRCQPLQRVRLSDKEPVRPADYFNPPLLLDHFIWWWYTEEYSADSEPSFIPFHLWFFLIPDREVGGCKMWPSREAALDALSDACLAWAREQAKQEVCHA